MPTKPKLATVSAPDLDLLLRTIASAMEEKQAENVRVLDVCSILGYTDAVVIASGRNDRQVMAIADGIEHRLRSELGLKPATVEGRAGATWVCMDYGDVVIHIFYSPARAYYEIDSMWPDARDRSSEFASA